MGLSQNSWGWHFGFIGFIRFGPWCTADDSNESKVAPETLDSGPLQAPSGASEENGSSECNESKVGPKARTLDALDAFDSDPGSESNAFNENQSGARGQDM